MNPTNIRYFHKDHNLNNYYYISTYNVLSLSSNTAAVFADCKYKSQPAKIFVIKYPSIALQDSGWKGFCRVKFLKPVGRIPSDIYIEEVGKGKFTGIIKIKGKRGEPLLAICLEVKTPQACKTILQKLRAAFKG